MTVSEWLRRSGGTCVAAIALAGCAAPEHQTLFVADDSPPAAAFAGRGDSAAVRHFSKAAGGLYIGLSESRSLPADSPTGPGRRRSHPTRYRG
jgi:hypothetical protein